MSTPTASTAMPSSVANEASTASRLASVTVLPHPQLCPQGTQFEIPGKGKLVDALLSNGIAIEHACEKVGACATCHVHIREGMDAVNAADEEEEDQLDEAWGLDAQSRLACCVRLQPSVRLVIELPRHTRNLAREGE